MVWSAFSSRFIGDFCSRICRKVLRCLLDLLGASVLEFLRHEPTKYWRFEKMKIDGVEDSGHPNI